MTRRQKTIRWLTVSAIIILVPASLLLGLDRIHVDADITSSMPKGDVVVDSAAQILGRHPALDLVTIDLHSDCTHDKSSLGNQRLVEAAAYVEESLKKSGLFDTVGMDDAAGAMPELFHLVLEHLPQMFNSAQLEQDIAPLVTPRAIERALQEQMKKLSGLQGVGQARAMSKDPLGFRDVVLGRMAALNPTKGAHLYSGQLISEDGCHLLLLADPQKPGSDTAQARKIVSVLDGLKKQLARKMGEGPEINLTAIGAFRSALDNETIARADTKRALWIATMGVALLLLLCFPRPWLGLLALVPAVAGLSFALLIYSLVESSISALALGFGGALISISVDHAIAYLQFLDRAQGITGKQASREVWSVGLVAALTTIGAFLTLYFSGVSMLGQVGLFAALGVGLSFIFVHIAFPLLFPEIKSSKRSSILPVPAILGRLTRGKSWFPVALAGLFAASMLLIGQPGFQVDLESMNTVTQQTLDAEKLVRDTWGDVFKRTYLLSEQATLEKLRQKTDDLVDIIHQARAAGSIKSGFSPSMILPGAALARKNTEAWRKFFNEERVKEISKNLSRTGERLGFSSDAFSPFVSSLTKPDEKPAPVPKKLFGVLGITHSQNGDWIWVGALEPGPNYDSEKLYQHAQTIKLAVFDPALFSKHMSQLLKSSFTRMLIIVGCAVLVLLIILFLDATLVAITIMPLAFALVCTMGMMKLLDHPMDIPSLMLGVVVLGMGVDYALYFVKAQQRYFLSESPSMDPIRVAVFLAASSTLVGLGTLAMADHAVPRSAGFTTLLGIGFSLLGAFVILPPFLSRLFTPRSFAPVSAEPGSPAHIRAIRRRYAHLEPSVRMFARFKLIFDPMFHKLVELAGPVQKHERVLDMGCGYGLVSCYLAAIMPNARFLGVEPDPHRSRIANRVMGERAKIEKSDATRWDAPVEKFDLALMIDLVHHLGDKELQIALSKIFENLLPGAKLVVRADIPGQGRFAWERWLEAARLHAQGKEPVFRSEQQISTALRDAGFELQISEPSAMGREETWFIARVPKEAKA